MELVWEEPWLELGFRRPDLMPSEAVLLELLQVFKGTLYSCLLVRAKEVWQMLVEKLACPHQHSGHLAQAAWAYA